MIKLFEEYNEYYTETSRREFCDATILEFTPEEIKYLSQLYKTINFFYRESIYRKNKWPKDDIIISIYKLKDEWYILSVEPETHQSYSAKYYKCDQMEGLVKLLDIL